MYYLSSRNTVYSSYEIKRKTGLDPLVTTNLNMLNRAGVFPVSNAAASVDFDTRLYTATVVYTINGQYADKSFTATDKPLADAKVAGAKAVKENYESLASAASGDYGIFTIAAISAKTSAQRTSEETYVIDAVKAVANNLSTDLTTISNATTVDEINTVVNG